MKIHYEEATLSDCEEIYTVMQTSAREISRKAYSEHLKDTFDSFYIGRDLDYIRRTLEESNNYTVTAKSNKRIVGFIQLKIVNQAANVSHLYVLPGYEGRSIGAHLLGLIRDKAVTLRLTKLYTESTLNAVSFYERYGFVNKGLIPDKTAYDLELELEY